MTTIPAAIAPLDVEHRRRAVDHVPRLQVRLVQHPAARARVRLMHAGVLRRRDEVRFEPLELPHVRLEVLRLDIRVDDDLHPQRLLRAQRLFRIPEKRDLLLELLEHLDICLGIAVDAQQPVSLRQAVPNRDVRDRRVLPKAAERWKPSNERTNRSTNSSTESDRPYFSMYAFAASRQLQAQSKSVVFES